MAKIDTNPKIPPLVRVADKSKINIRYPLILPYSAAHVYWDSKINEVVYDLEEPILSVEEQEQFGKLQEYIQQMININLFIDKTQESIEDYMEKIIRLVVSETGMKIGEESFDKLFYYIYRDFVGLNEIEALMHDYFIEDVECNGVNEPLYVVHRLYRNLKTNIKFKDVEKLASFVEKIAQKCGRYVSYANPLLDGSLPDGSRVNATYTKDVTSKGPTFTIRKFTKTPWTPIQLLSFGTYSPEMIAFLWIMMQYKLNVLIAGGTGSGKTTLLNAIAFFIPPEARVVSIEDTRELNLPRENWLPSVSRTSVSAGGVGEVDMFSLLKNSFRQNPDYVIVGEVRGKEASVLFQGMASGHASMGTIHADSVDTVVRRLETPPIELSPTLVNELDAVVVMSHAVVNGKETRKLREIVEVINVTKDGTTQTNTPFLWDPSRDKFYYKLDSHVFEKIRQRNGVFVDSLKKELDVRTKLIFELYKRKVFDTESLQKVVNDYYKNPAEVLKQFNIQ